MYFKCFLNYFVFVFIPVFGQPPVLKSMYYQMAGNAGARNAQNYSHCVIARFSNSNNNSQHANYIFQGMVSPSNKVVSYQGEFSSFTMTSGSMYCANMTKIDPVSGERIPSVPHRSLCAWKYDPVASDWILFTDKKKTMIFALVSDRHSVFQKEKVDRYITQWEQEYNVTLLRTPFDQKTCNQFTPP